MKFVDKPLSNFYLMDWMRFLEIKNFRSVISRDHIVGIERYGIWIANLNRSDEPGSHWVVIVNNPDEHILYFDSFGMEPPNELISLANKMGKKYLFNSSQYQAKESVRCGYYCIFFANELSKGKSYHEIVHMLSQTDMQRNERLIKRYFENLSKRII